MMHIMNKNIFVGILSLLFLLGASNVYAQYDNTLFSLPTVIQKNQINPAYIPKMKYHAGFPGLSSSYVGFGNSGFRYNQMFNRRADDSLVFDKASLLSALKEKNNLHLNISNQWLNAGYKWKDYYFSLSVSDVVSLDFNFPKSLFELALNGNGENTGTALDLGHTSLRYLHYREYALGAAWELDKKLNVGAKVKFLFGKSAINTSDFDLLLTTTDNTFYITTEANVDASSAIPSSWYDDNSDIKNSEYLFYSGNFGLAFDFGATYKYNSKFSFAASVLDLGYIQYERYAKHHENKNLNWSFQGFDIWNFEGMDTTQLEEEFSNIGDSLQNKLDLTTTNERFKTMLNGKVYLSGSYNLSNKEEIGVLLRSEFYNSVWRPSFTASYAYKVNSQLSAVAAYSIASRSYFNIGLGVVYNYAPVQVYISTDNVIGVFVPDAVHQANFHLGVNIIFPEKSSGRSLIE